MASALPGALPGLPREITQLSFFFSRFRNSDEAAEFVISNDKGPGTFILRPSTRSPGALTLTISINNRHARHVNVKQMPDDNSRTGTIFFIISERSFPSFHDLYAYYTENPISNMEQVDNVRLLNPLTRTSAPVPLPPLAPSPGLPSSLSSASGTPPSLSSAPGPLSFFSPAPGPPPPFSPAPGPPAPFSPAPGPPTSLSPSSSRGSEISSHEIPPLPRKISTSSMASKAESVKSDHSQEVPGLSDVQSRIDRTSLDSHGSETHRVSGSSNSSGTFVGDQGGPAGDVSFYLPTGSSSVEDMVGVVQLPVSPPTATLSKKVLKKLQKQEEKEEKKRKKEEKKEEKKAKKNRSKEEKEMDEREELGWCRPPLPIPQVELPGGEEDPYYSSPRPYTNHLEELKKMLQESEICDCGLRMMDAELVDGWTVHRSRESATFKRVFYQHEDGNTTWLFPNSIADLLSVTQVGFIVRLSLEAKQEVPQQVMHRYEIISQISSQNRVHATPSSSSLHSAGSDQYSPQSLSSRESALDQRPPMAGPSEY